MTPGDRLRADLEAALAAASAECGKPLEWSETERDIIARAASTADRAVAVAALFDAEQGGEQRATVLVKLSAELRALDRQVVDLVARLEFGPGVAKNPQKVRAARARWDRGA